MLYILQVTAVGGRLKNEPGIVDNLPGECRTLWGECERAAQWFGNVAEFEQVQKQMLPTPYVANII